MVPGIRNIVVPLVRVGASRFQVPRRGSRREILAERLLLPQPRKSARRPFYKETPVNR